MFTTTVDQSFVSMIDHYFELPEVESDGGEVDQLVAAEEQGFGQELTTESTDREQGFFQIQVLEPHGYWSNVADYNVEPCQPEQQYIDGLRQPDQRIEGGGEQWIIGGTDPQERPIAPELLTESDGEGLKKVLP